MQSNTDLQVLVSRLEALEASRGAAGAGPATTAPKARFRSFPQGWDIAVSKDGSAATCLQNVATILAQDTEWQGVLCYDLFRNSVVFRKPPPWFPEDAPAEERIGEALQNSDYSRLALWISRAYRLKPAANLCAEAATVVAERASFHPVRDYLRGLPKWDGTKRLSKWLRVYLGAAPDPTLPEEERKNAALYLERVGRWWMIAAVARVMRPGCKADAVLILEGAQGKGKSTALRILAGEWFADTPIEIGSVEGYISIRGRWIVELAELDSLSRTEANRAKAFFSSPVDVYRPKYGRDPQEYPRQCVFAGTTNQGAYLHDETGGRRFWPVRCGFIDLEALRRDRDQLWAEALAAFDAEELWYPSGQEEIDACKTEQEERYQLDPWHDRIAGWLAGKEQVTIPEVLAEALKIEIGHWGRNEEGRVGKVLRFLRWERKKVRDGKKTRWAFLPPEGSDAAEDTPESEF
jgi:putative DNA primase/helicase